MTNGGGLRREFNVMSVSCELGELGEGMVAVAGEMREMSREISRMRAKEMDKVGKMWWGWKRGSRIVADGHMC